MSARTAPLSAALEPLHLLLAERGARDRGQAVALGISYLTHAAALLAVLAVARHRPYESFGAATSAGILAVTPLYSAGAPPGPRPKPAVAAAAVAPAPLARPEPPAAPARPTEPQATPAEDLLAVAKPERRDRSRQAASRSTPAASARGQAAATPGGGALPAAHGPPGSPTGTLTGDSDGGLSTLLFSNQWYVARVRDIVYSNWGDPFLAQPRPNSPLLTVVRFRIGRDGRVSEVEIETPTGNAAWDRAARRAVENSTLPPLPPDYPGSSVVVHYEFNLDLSR